MSIFKSFNSFFAVLLVLVMSFSSISCSSTSNLVITLSAISDACSAGLVVIQALEAAGKIDPVAANLAVQYVSIVSVAAEKSVTELDSSDTNAQKIQVIVDAFAAVATPAFGSGVSTTIVSIVNSVASAVQIFLQQLQSPAVTLAAKSAAPVSVTKLSHADKTLLKKALVKFHKTDLLAAQLLAKK